MLQLQSTTFPHIIRYTLLPPMNKNIHVMLIKTHLTFLFFFFCIHRCCHCWKNPLHLQPLFDHYKHVASISKCQWMKHEGTRWYKSALYAFSCQKPFCQSVPQYKIMTGRFSLQCNATNIFSHIVDQFSKIRGIVFKGTLIETNVKFYITRVSKPNTRSNIAKVYIISCHESIELQLSLSLCHIPSWSRRSQFFIASYIALLWPFLSLWYLFHHPFTQTCQVIYLVFSFSSLAIRIPHDY